MMRTLKSGLTIGMLVAALAMTAGCGENDNSGNENGNDNDGGNPTPVRTATPAAATPTVAPTSPGPTATPDGTGDENTITFNIAASAAAQGFELAVAYPTAKGGFRGSADGVACSTTSGGSFVPNDQDNGNLILIVGNAVNLTFPYTITCTFDATAAVTAADFQVTVDSVVQNGVSGDTSILTVTVGVS
jgi:hypothetical protein